MDACIHTYDFESKPVFNAFVIDCVSLEGFKKIYFALFFIVFMFMYAFAWNLGALNHLLVSQYHFYIWISIFCCIYSFDRLFGECIQYPSMWYYVNAALFQWIETCLPKKVLLFNNFFFHCLSFSVQVYFEYFADIIYFVVR